MELFTSRPVGDGWRSRSGALPRRWTLTALPLFIWMGEILFRTKLSEDMFKGLAPWLERLPGRLLHTNIIGCTIFAAVSGSSAATCATIGKMTLPELERRGYPEQHRHRHAGRRRHPGPADPALDHHDRLRRRGQRVDRPALHRRRLSRASCWPACSWATPWSGRCSIRARSRRPTHDHDLRREARDSRNLIPVVALIGAVLGSIYSGIATATEAAALGVVGALVIAISAGRHALASSSATACWAPPGSTA